MERSRPALVLGCGVGAVLDEDPCNIEMTVPGRLVEGCQPVLVLGGSVGVSLDEELGKIYMALSRRKMQRS